MAKNPFSKSTFNQFPELATENLLLTEIKPAHAPDIFAHFSAESVTQYLDVTRMVELGEAERLITFLAERFSHERGIRWGVMLQGEAHIIGTVGFNIWRKRKFYGELGYDLSEAYRRQGIMTEAVEAVLDFGFSQMSLQKIEALILPENTASEAFLKQFGFEWQGRVREFQGSTGRHAYMNLFGLIKVHWLLRKNDNTSYGLRPTQNST